MPLERFSEFLVRQLLASEGVKPLLSAKMLALWVAIAPIQEISAFGGTFCRCANTNRIITW
ncbi:hypothetical protein [Microcoleus sp. D2_18a_D3]|uniref:hypothetical protein n=1 Tax=Microcoleus sp. D2_18a_D3 TaxID=3055330 RepID=UPI002FD2E8DD